MTQTEGDRGEHSDGCKHGCEHFEMEDNNDGKEIEEPKVKEVHFKTDEKVTEEKDIKDLIEEWTTAHHTVKLPSMVWHGSEAWTQVAFLGSFQRQW